VSDFKLPKLTDESNTARETSSKSKF
jgi:hypothetical protein